MKQYLLIEMTKAASKINAGATVHRLVWVCMDAADEHYLEMYETCVDDSMRNFTRSGWDQIIAAKYPWGVYSGLIRTARTNRQGTNVISADSHPCLEIPIPDYTVMVEVLQRAIAEHQSPQFHSLFE